MMRSRLFPWRRGHARRSQARTGPYDAFISYSHAVDGKLAPALQSGLHRFARAWNQLRAVRVFLDEASLSANPSLWSSIEQALADARFFILLASPEAVRSHWVEREVRYWLEHKPHTNILIAVTDGELSWDSSVKDFDWTRSSAVPRALRGVFSEEPRYVDLGWARNEAHISLNNARFRECVADLAAPLHGRSKDELTGEDVAQRKRTKRLAQSAVALISTLALVASAAAVVAVNQRDLARAERNSATSRLLASQAGANASSRPVVSMLLAAQALNEANTPEARGAVITQFQRNYNAKEIIDAGGGAVGTLAFGAGGQLLAFAGTDRIIRLWDVRRRTMLARLTGSDSAVTALAFSPDGQVLASAQRTIRLWDVARRTQLGTLSGHQGDVVALAFRSDGRTLVSAAGDGTVRLWDLDRRRQRRAIRITPDAAPLVAAFSADGRMLAAVVGLADRRVYLWDITRGRRIATLPEQGSGSIETLAFSPDGRALAVAGGRTQSEVVSYDQIEVWDVPARSHLYSLDEGYDTQEGPENAVSSVAFSPDSQMLASVGDGREVNVWDLSSGSAGQEVVLEGHTDQLSAVAFSADGRTIASAGREGIVRLWAHPPSTSSATEVPIDSGTIFDLALSPDTQTLAWADDSGKVGLWSRTKRTPLSRAQQLKSTAEAVAFSPDGRLLATGGGVFADEADETSFRDRATIMLWDLDKQKPFSVLRPPKGSGESQLPGGIGDVAFSPDGRLFAFAVSSRVRLWDAHKWVQLADWEAISGATTLPFLQSREVYTLAFSPDSQVLASAGSDGVIRLWDVNRRTLLATLGGHRDPIYTLAISPDGTTLASADQAGKILLWDLQRRAQAAALAGHERGVLDLAFSPDGRTLASGGFDWTVRLWDLSRNIELASLTTQNDVVYALVYGPDGQTLYSAGVGNSIRIWNLDIWALQRQLCSTAHRDLSPEEWAEFLPDRPYRKTCSAEGRG